MTRTRVQAGTYLLADFHGVDRRVRVFQTFSYPEGTFIHYLVLDGRSEDQITTTNITNWLGSNPRLVG
jgi:hypothetical protein